MRTPARGSFEFRERDLHYRQRPANANGNQEFGAVSTAILDPENNRRPEDIADSKVKSAMLTPLLHWPGDSAKSSNALIRKARLLAYQLGDPVRVVVDVKGPALAA
jgi:hypothetical protein